MEKIKWHVLSKNNNEYTLVADKILNASCFNDDNNDKWANMYYRFDSDERIKYPSILYSSVISMSSCFSELDEILLSGFNDKYSMIYKTDYTPYKPADYPVNGLTISDINGVVIRVPSFGEIKDVGFDWLKKETTDYAKYRGCNDNS